MNYQHSRNELQPSANLDTWRFSYGGQLMLRLPMGFEFSTNLHENSRRGFNDPSSNANGRSDTRYNSINSYAMLHVRYRLNMFGGKVDTEGRYDKKWGNRDRR